MDVVLSSTWLGSVQAVLAIAGTWLLAFGLKSVRKADGFATSNPRPLSSRFWLGLVLITLSLMPPLVSPFISNR
jgi:hypothetical protein